MTIVRPSATYPELEPLRVAASDAPFLLSTARDFNPGAPIDLTLTVRSDQGIIELPAFMHCPTSLTVRTPAGEEQIDAA